MSKIVRKHWKPIIFSLSILIFLVITNLLLKEQIHVFDNFIFSGIKRIRTEPLTIVFKFITFFCSTEFLLIATIAIMVFSKNKKRAFYIALNVLICFLLNQGLKHVFLRPRPEVINLITEGGYSFPSGHSMASMAFYGLIIYFIFKNVKNKIARNSICVALSSLIFLIGISRIYLGVHYASDVIAGFLVSIAYLVVYITGSLKLIGLK